MKKILILILCCLLLSGCAETEGNIHFYYRQKELAYGSSEPVIVREYRAAPGHEKDLTYLINMYLEGPLDDTMTAPFPKGTALEDFTYADATMYVTLTEAYATLDGIEHTIASACIAYTCFDLTKAEKVIIKCSSPEHGNKSITLTRDSLLMEDFSTAPAE